MKVAAALSLAIAQVALAKSIHNVYPIAANRRDGGPGPGPGGRHGGNHDVGPGFNNQGLDIADTEVVEVFVIWVCPGAGAATTTVNPASTVLTAGAAGITQGSNTIPPGQTGTIAAGSQATHTVTVGGSAGTVYTPDTIAANVGDTVIFTFLSANHTVTQSSFATPCEKLDGGMDSGFQPNPNNTVNPPPQVAMQVMSSGPLWFYCRQKGHCGKGMTFSINPTASKTQAEFQAAAIAQNGTGSDSTITGGNSGSASAAAGSDSSASLTATLGGVATATATDSVAAAGATGGVQSGSGTLNADGSCSCSVLCAAGSFPANGQGLGAFGGYGGSLPMTMSA